MCVKNDKEDFKTIAIGVKTVADWRERLNLTLNTRTNGDLQPIGRKWRENYSEELGQVSKVKEPD